MACIKGAQAFEMDKSVIKRPAIDNGGIVGIALDRQPGCNARLAAPPDVPGVKCAWMYSESK